MDIRSSLDGLKTLLGVTPAATASAQRVKTGPGVEGSSLSSDSATLSSAGSEVALTASEGSVRTDKVAEIQAALAAGTYQIPSSAVAAKMVDAMLGRGQ
jgi:negative regulator of flagellin synthesis FlgM